MRRIFKVIFIILMFLIFFANIKLEAKDLTETQRIEELLKLERQFDKNKDFYMSTKYKEKDVRKDFIDPFLDLLGWDTQNSKQVLLYQQDSVPEARLDIYKYTKFVDYSQKLNDRGAFFVEAKAASKNIDDPDYIFQAKRYCWSSSRVELVILTDYETLRVYDCRIKPDYNKPEQGELKQFRLNYNQFAKNERLLWRNLAKENVAKGSITRLLTSVNDNLERQPMQQALVRDLDNLRLNLAKDIYKNNKKLSVKAISEASQNILNKLLFIRILEDRDIVTTKKLQNAVMTFYKDDSLFMGNKGHYLKKEKMREPKDTLYLEIQDYFREFDKKFNGAIFAPHFSDNLTISNDVMRDTIKELYGVYDFSIVPIEVIGKAYESYLGRGVAIKDGSVILKERPEVRTAGGVFYTPSWVARYMIKQTIGKKIKDKTPESLSNIKILDPACGSGVFPALTALELFNHLEDYYNRNPHKIRGSLEFPDAYKLENGKYILSAKKKAELITNSIFCTDIDKQAIENTIMWLYILILEDSGSSVAQKERKYKIPNKAKLTHYEKFELPSLKENIVNANFLIGTDFGTLEENERVRAFDWKSGKIGEIMSLGGFDVVIGNPPYIQARKFKSFEPKQYYYLRKNYRTLKAWQSDIFYTFFEKGDTLLNSTGEMSLIVGNIALTGKTAKNLRKFLTDKVSQIVDFGYNEVFPNVGTTSAIIFTSKHPYQSSYVGFDKVSNIEYVFSNFEYMRTNRNYYIKHLSNKDLASDTWSFDRNVEKNILSDNKDASLRLSDIANVFKGQSSGYDKAFIISDPEKLVLETDCLKPYVRSKDIKRYIPVIARDYIIYPYDNKGKLLSEDQFRDKCPRTYDYLSQYKVVLLAKKGNNAQNWFKLARNANYKLSMQPKIYTNFVNDELQNFSIDVSGGSFFIASITYAVSSKDTKISNEAILGILNSSLIRDYLYTTGEKVGAYRRHKVADLKNIPIVPYNENTKSLYEEIEDRVKQILEVKHKKVDTSILERRIDDLVLKLYGVNKKAIATPPAKELLTILKDAA